VIHGLETIQMVKQLGFILLYFAQPILQAIWLCLLD